VHWVILKYATQGRNSAEHRCGKGWKQLLSLEGREYDTIRQWRTQEFFSWGGSTKSVEERRQRERGSGGGSPLVRGFWRQL